MRICCLSLLLLLTAACSRAPDPRGVGHDEILLQVSASGRTDTRPDEARFTAGVQTIAAGAGAASAGNNAGMERVTRAVEALGIKPDDVQTRSVTLSRIDYGPNRGRFEANNLIEVRVRDLKQAGAAIAATTEAGANVLSGPNLGISDPEAASRTAYAAAYRAARARAETYAKTAGLRIARVLAIRDSGVEDGSASYERNGIIAMEVDAASPPIRGGMTTSEVRVRVDFALEE